jgi:hypothetical protein
MAITLRNSTGYPAQFLAKRGQQIIARLPAVEKKGGSLALPTNVTYVVEASTVIDGNTYTSARIEVTSGDGFLAEVRQIRDLGTYEFHVKKLASSAPDQMEFQKTCLNPVKFTILKDGLPLQTVNVDDSFKKQVLHVGDSYSVYAVINGVTTALLETDNVNATMTAVEDTSDLEAGYFTLELS